MATASLPPQPKHGRDWARDKPTLGAVILILLVGIAFGVTAILQGFSTGHTNEKIKHDEECQAQIQQDNFNRNKALTDLNARDKAAANRLMRRIIEDIQVGKTADLSRAWDAYRADVNSNDKARASLGQLLTGSALPSNCKLKLGSVAPTRLPGASSGTPRPSSTSLPPLSTTVTTMVTAQRTATVTRTLGGHVQTFTATIPGPVLTRRITITVSRRGPTIARTATVTTTTTRTVPRAPITRTVTVRVTATRVVTVTVTVSRPVPPTSPPGG